MTVETIRDALCITVRNDGEYGAFFVRETTRGKGDEQRIHCELTINSGFGNVGYHWGHMGKPAHEFFDSDDKDYFLTKLFGDRSHVFDAERTLKELKKQLFHDLRHGDVESHQARTIYDAINHLSVTASSVDELYHEMCDDLEFDDEKKALLEWRDAPEIPWCTTLSPQALGLWEHLWPEFVQALKDERNRPSLVP